MTNTQQAAVGATLIVVGLASLMDAPNLLGNFAGGFALFVGILAAYNSIIYTAK